MKLFCIIDTFDLRVCCTRDSNRHIKGQGHCWFHIVDILGNQGLVFNIKNIYHCLLDSLVVKCWLQVREVPGSIPSQGPRLPKDVIEMVPVVPLFSTEKIKRKILALSQELR